MILFQDAIVKAGFGTKKVWMGETGSISGRGIEGYTDAYANGFLLVCIILFFFLIFGCMIKVEECNRLNTVGTRPYRKVTDTFVLCVIPTLMEPYYLN